MKHAWLLASVLAACAHAPAERAGEAQLERVRVSEDGRGFVLASSGRPFVPWGFNYDHDARPDERLLEDYWQSEWSTVEEDFREMKSLGANVVRIHLRLARFMSRRSEVDRAALARLRELLRLGERTGLRIELTGLCTYRKAEVPAWYDELDETERWEVQARWWDAVAAAAATSSALFSFDLMNEPAVPSEPRQDWLGPAFEDGRTYVEYLTRAPAGRDRAGIGRAWIRRMTKAIRNHDRSHLVTVGLFVIGDQVVHLPVGLTPTELAQEVDYLSVHVYPKEGALEDSFRILDELSVGKPVLVEETGPLRCSLSSLRRFLEGARARAAGAMGFYWGKTIEECRRSTETRDALMLGWLEVFRELAPRLRGD